MQVCAESKGGGGGAKPIGIWKSLGCDIQIFFAAVPDFSFSFCFISGVSFI